MIYADYAAGAPVLPEVVETITEFLTSRWGNPSSHYDLGYDAANALEEARATIARSINADPSEIIFTGSGCESDSMIIRGVMARHPSGRFITSNVEHKAVLECSDWLSRQGYDVDRLAVNQDGIIDPIVLFERLRGTEALVSIMYSNNETGSVNNVSELARICHEKNVLFHSDMVQAYGKIPIDVKQLDVDSSSFSGHKLGAPSGIGFLYLKDGVEIDPLIFGSQERYLRGGTENVAYACGLAKAVEIKMVNLEERIKKTRENQMHLINGLYLNIPACSLNGPREGRLCNNVSFRFDGVNGEELLELLNLQGISASTGSACNSADNKPSHVLLAIGLTPEQASSTIRFSVSEDLTSEDVQYIIAKTAESVAILRRK